MLEFCHNLVMTKSVATKGQKGDTNASVYQLDILMAGGELSDIDIYPEYNDDVDDPSPYDEDDLYAMLSSVDAMPDFYLSH